MKFENSNMLVAASLLVMTMTAPIALGNPNAGQVSVAKATTAKSLALPRPSTVLARRDVQKDLATNRAQIADIDAIVKTAKLAAKKQDTAALDVLDAQLLGLLEETQVARLKEIRIQLAGIKAVFDTEVQTAIALTTDQIAQLRALGPKAKDSTLEAILTSAQKDALTKLGGETFYADIHP